MTADTGPIPLTEQEAVPHTGMIILHIHLPDRVNTMSESITG